MRTKLLITLFVLVICSACSGQETITLAWEFHASADDSVRLYEVDSVLAIATEIVTVPAVDSVYTFEMIADNQRHYFAAKGYLLNENTWSGYSNVIDTLLVAPPKLWFKKKQ